MYFDHQAAVAQGLWSLRDPVGEVLLGSLLGNVDFADQGPITLAAGTYRLELEAQGVASAYQLEIHSVVDEASVIGVGQSPNGVIDGPGATASFSFPVLEGEILLFDLLAGDGQLHWSAFDPVGEPLFLDLLASDPGSHDQGPFQLAAGTYTLVLDPRYATAPAYSFKLVGGASVPALPVLGVGALVFALLAAVVRRTRS